MVALKVIIGVYRAKIGIFSCKSNPQIGWLPTGIGRQAFSILEKPSTLVRFSPDLQGDRSSCLIAETICCKGLRKNNPPGNTVGIPFGKRG
jgi:hypothetical protein